MSDLSAEAGLGYSQMIRFRGGAPVPRETLIE